MSVSAAAPAPARPLSSQRTPLDVRLARLGYRLLSAAAPALAGKVATNHFLSSRPRGARPSAGLPLGARQFPIKDEALVRQGFLWDAKGPTVLLVHGWGADSSSLFGFVRPLVNRGFRVAAFDAPAHGTSAGKRTTMTEFVRAVGHVLDTLGGAHAVVAHSLGGIAAIAAVARRAEAGSAPPRRMVLLSAPCALPTVIERWSNFLRVGPNVVARLYRELDRRNGVPPMHWNIAVLGRELAVPVALIHDRADPMVPFDEAQKIAAALRDAQIEETVDLGHRRILFASAVHQRVVDFIASSRGDAAVIDGEARAAAPPLSQPPS
jgi:pimeloyl-ACP methyl ester carboxylesterase